MSHPPAGVNWCSEKYCGRMMGISETTSAKAIELEDLEARVAGLERTHGVEKVHQ